MKHITAAKKGAQAFLDGKGRAPALNTAFLKDIFENNPSDIAIEMMDAYSIGWTYAMLGHNASDDFPSAKMFKTLMESN